MKLTMQKIENKEMAVKAMKKVIKNMPFVLATSIPVAGSVVTLIKDTYDDIQLVEELEGIGKDFDSLKSFGAELENFQLELEAFQSEFKNIQAEFERSNKDAVTANEEYSIKNVKGIEMFFADHVEINDYDFIVELENALEEINQEYKSQSKYECEYGDYILYEESLKILFSDVCDREYVDEYIEKITVRIYDHWHDVSRIGKVKYY